LNAGFASLRPLLSNHDRTVLDQHLTSLRAYEAAAANMLPSSPPGRVVCALPASFDKVPTDAASVQAEADVEFFSPFVMDATAMALGCGLTRVVTISFGFSGGGAEGGLRMPWLGFPDALMSVAENGGNPTLVAKYAKMNWWIVTQVKYLMDQLAAIPTPTGTLLDETTIYFFNREGDGNGHSGFALPNVILGGTGGYFKTGQNLSLAATNPTEVLISLAHAMGVPVSSFGSGPFVATGELAILKA
jgi:hypothetical protein